MKGVIFTIFRTMVEERFGERMMDDILEDSAPESEGAYTSLGDYSHAELLGMVKALSRRTGISSEDLTLAFGGYLIGVFSKQFSGYFERAPDTFSFLRLVPEVIHKEVRNLYERAHPPRFDCTLESADHLVIVYTSPRALATLARGMIQACCEHYRESIRVEQSPVAGDPHSHRFDLWRAA